MRKLKQAFLIICSVLILTNACSDKGGSNKSSSSSSSSKSGKGGHYVGGVGSSHKGGHYVGPDGSSGYNKSGSSSSNSGSSHSSYQHPPDEPKGNSSSSSGISHRSANTSKIHVSRPHYTSANIGSGVARYSHGRIERSQAAKDEFLKQHGYSTVPAGCEVDHIIPLYAGGSDTPGNMQLLTKAQHHSKTKADFSRYGR